MGGGQFKQAVKAIMDAEAQPIKTMEARKAKEEAKMKLFQEFKTKFQGVDKALQEVSSFRKLRELKVDLGDGTNIASVTLDKEKAQPGTYTIQVQDLAARSSVISNGFEDPDEASLGVGFIVMNTSKGEHNEIFVDGKNSSLHGIASLINQQADAPVRASVVRDATDPDQAWKLILTGKKDGAENQIDFPDFYFMDGDKDFFIDDNKDAKNARITMDGFPIETDSNDINDFLPGVNLHLKQARPEQPFTMTITEDQQKVAGKVKSVIDQINGVLGFINKQNQVDEKTDTSTTFAGDTGLQNIEYRVRNLIHEGFPVGKPGDDGFKVVFLSQMGIELDKGGNLTFNEGKFSKYMEKDYDSASEAITGSFGFAFQLGELFKGYTRPSDGFLAQRETSIRGRIKDIDNQIASKQRNLDIRQQALTEQFSRLESSLSNMQRQQQAVQAMGGGGGGGGNMVAQLLGG